MNSTRRWLKIIAIIFSVSSLVYYYYTYFILSLDPWLDSVPIGIETISIFIFAFFYFFEQLNDTESLFVYSKPSFWAIIGVILYLAGSFFVYISANQIDSKDLGKYWIITNISSIMKNVLFCVTIYIQTNQNINKKFKSYNLLSTYF
jgi:hypothetical protein